MDSSGFFQLLCRELNGVLLLECLRQIYGSYDRGTDAVSNGSVNSASFNLLPILIHEPIENKWIFA